MRHIIVDQGRHQSVQLDSRIVIRNDFLAFQVLVVPGSGRHFLDQGHLHPHQPVRDIANTEMKFVRCAS